MQRKSKKTKPVVQPLLSYTTLLLEIRKLKKRIKDLNSICDGLADRTVVLREHIYENVPSVFDVVTEVPKMCATCEHRNDCPFEESKRNPHINILCPFLYQQLVENDGCEPKVTIPAESKQQNDIAAIAREWKPFNN